MGRAVWGSRAKGFGFRGIFCKPLICDSYRMTHRSIWSGFSTVWSLVTDQQHVRGELIPIFWEGKLSLEAAETGYSEAAQEDMGPLLFLSHLHGERKRLCPPALPYSCSRHEWSG